MGGLPNDILVRRLTNELQTLCDYLGADMEVSEEVFNEFPVEIRFTIENIPSYEKHGDWLEEINSHSFYLIIDKGYPFQKPRVRWDSPIFHPNIMSPDEGGHVCIKLLDSWDFNSSLVSFVRGVEHLIANPNPFNPFGTGSCIEAAEHYLSEDSEEDSPSEESSARS